MSAPRVKPSRQASSDTIDWQRYTVWLMLAALSVSVFIVYWQTIHHGFTIVDDNAYIYENPHVAGGLTWEAFRRVFTMSDVGNWHPLTWFSHMVDVELNGLDAGWHHITSVVIHAATACTLFLALRRMTGTLWRSALVAAIFALHPLRVESVAWVAERKDVLSGFFCMLTLWAYAWYAEKPKPSRYLLVMGLFALGLMSKSMLVTLPAVLLLLDVWPLRRWRESEDASEKLRCPARTLWQLVLEKLPLFALSGIVSIIIVNVQGAVGSMNMVSQIPLKFRMANALISTVMYLWNLIWPFNLAMFYPHPAVLKQDLPALMRHGVIAGACLAVVTVFVLWRAKRFTYLAVGWFWYLLTLLPVIGMIQVGTQARADRYTYIPMIGITLMLVWGGAWLVSRWPRVQRAMKIVLPCLLLALLVRSYHQTSLWKTDQVLFEHGCQVVPNNYFLEHNIGVVLWRAGDYEKAGKHFKESVRLAPDYDGGNHALGIYYALYAKDMRMAAQHFEHTINVNPHSLAGWRGLGFARLQLGQREAGLAAMYRALEILPEDSETLRNLGLELYDQGKCSEGLVHCRKAIPLNPTDTVLLSRTAWGLATHSDASIRNGREAVGYARRVMQLAPSAQAFDILAAAYAECGQFEKAVETATEGQTFARQRNDQGMVNVLASRLARYNQQQPYHEAHVGR